MKTLKWPVTRDEKGQVVILLAFLLPLIIGLLGLAVDLAWITYWKSHIQNAADFSALSGAQYLPLDTPNAYSTALNVFQKNYVRNNVISNINFFNSNFDIKVHYDEKLPLIFLPAIGYKEALVSGKAEVKIRALHQPEYIIPIGISSANNLTYGQEVSIWGDTVDYTRGNFGVIDPTGDKTMSTQDLQSYIAYDYKGEKGMPVSGGFVYTKTGTIAYSR